MDKRCPIANVSRKAETAFQIGLDLSPSMEGCDEVVDRENRSLQCRADPADGFMDVGMLLQEVGPMPDAFVVKSAIAQIQYLIESFADGTN